MDAQPVDHDKFDQVYNDVLEKKKSVSPESDEEDFSYSRKPVGKIESSPEEEPATSKPKFRSRFLDKVRGTLDDDSSSKAQSQR